MAWANELKNLASEIANMHTYREDHMNQLKNDTKKKMKGWEDERSKMKTDLFAELEQGDKERAAEVNNLKASVQDFLKKFKDEELAAIIEEHRQRAQDMARFKADVGKMIAEFKVERDQAASAWKDLVGNMGKGPKKTKEKKAAKETKAEEGKE